MVTFPGAYHGGFSCGLNCGEAVNFAPADWLRFGAASAARYHAFRKPSLLSYEWLLLKVALLLVHAVAAPRLQCLLGSCSGT